MADNDRGRDSQSRDDLYDVLDIRIQIVSARLRVLGIAMTSQIDRGDRADLAQGSARLLPYVCPVAKAVQQQTARPAPGGAWMHLYMQSDSIAGCNKARFAGHCRFRRRSDR